MGEAVGTDERRDSNTQKKTSAFPITFFTGMAVYLTLIAIAGFWPTYFGPLFSG